MSPHINSAKQAAARLTDAMFALSPATRVGLVQYKDHGDAVVATTVVQLTADRSAFISALNSLFASGGGDTPEAVYSGLMGAFNGQPWRTGALKFPAIATRR